MMKAVSYLRVSGKGQIEGDGFPRQREAVQRYAKTNGIEIAKEFRDEGVSGTTDLENREGLAALIDRIESNGIRVVLVENATRLARDLMVGEVILGQLRDLGVEVYDASGNELTGGDGDPTRTLIRQVLGAVAQFEKSVLVLKLRASRDRIRRTAGRCEGRKPFGYYLGEEVTLKEMKRLYRRNPRTGDRRSYAAIATELNRLGLKPRSGKPWNRGSVHAILRRKSKSSTRR